MTAGRIYLDSADLGQAAQAACSGVVTGITTNPAIMAAHTSEPLRQLSAVLHAFADGPVFHQLTATDVDGAAAEVAAVQAALGDQATRVVLKLPAQQWWYEVGAGLVADDWRVAFTAVYSPGQAVCAAEIGAGWVIPYVDRSARLLPDAKGVVERLRPFVPDEVVLLAASLKTPMQALDALRDGADAITVTWDVIEALMAHPLTDSAVEEFRLAPGR